ncbi:NlpC/P60 family protein [Coralliovum pocilloporae]|uniref:C40 family peptidase n=1 Tax=Coralliovum pocilloporae TaxID=3066369 RepID=UPI003307B21E
MTGFSFDRRIHAARPDLADVRLKDHVTAERYVEGSPAWVKAAGVPLRPGPDPARPIDTELLMGESVLVFDERDGWSWCQNDEDGYVGYCPSDSLESGLDRPAATHRISAPSSFIYPEADLKYPPRARLSMGTGLAVVGEAETRGTPYLQLADDLGWIVATHASAADKQRSDYVDFAEAFLNVPYLWGGRTGQGLDCSALVQIPMMMAGQTVPRDSDMQARAIGASLGHDISALSFRRGDLIFWRGHVGIMSDAETLLHASGYQMMVVKEPLQNAVARIGANEFGAVTDIRRP